MICLHFTDTGRRRPLHVLCLGAHGDDIEIGCGGTLLKLIADLGGNVVIRWVVFAATPVRAREVRASARDFLKGAHQSKVVIGDFEDRFFPHDGRRLKEYVHQLREQYEPDIVFTHGRHDLHQDHRLISELTWQAFRDHLILEYEIPKYDGDLGSPNVFVPLDRVLCRRKGRLLLRHFASQRNKAWFAADTFLALLRLRGVECKSPSGYAEAFHGRKMVLE